jgi:hypothetical protein
LVEQQLHDKDPLLADETVPEVNPNADINFSTFAEWHPGQLIATLWL